MQMAVFIQKIEEEKQITVKLNTNTKKVMAFRKVILPWGGASAEFISFKTLWEHVITGQGTTFKRLREHLIIGQRARFKRR